MLRLIAFTAPSVSENLAMDDAAAKVASATGRRQLRFWWGGPPAVVMGYSERPEDAVDMASCARLGVDVLKRSTGGGSVLQTGGVLNYSLVAPAPGNLNPEANFRPGIEVICAILSAFGISGRVEGVSDVAVGDRKISGNAQSRRRKALLVHGTLLVDFDFDLAERVLRHPLREPEYRRGRGHREFMTTLRALGINADRAAIEKVAMESAGRVFGQAECIDRQCFAGRNWQDDCSVASQRALVSIPQDDQTGGTSRSSVPQRTD